MDTLFTIREETSGDRIESSNVVRRAFEEGSLGYNGEAELVENLRDSEYFLPKLALVAQSEADLVGHIILSRVFIETSDTRIPILILAPVSVLPEFQGRGIGGELIKAAHAQAEYLNEHHIFLLGYAAYYAKFGYTPSRNFRITFPEGMNNDNCMAIELLHGSLSKIQGTLEYSKPFYEI